MFGIKLCVARIGTGVHVPDFLVDVASEATSCRTGGWYRISIAVDDLYSLPFGLHRSSHEGQMRRAVKAVNARRAFNPSVAAASCRLVCRGDARLYAGMDSALRWILHNDGSADHMEAMVPKTPVLMIAAALLTASPACAQNAATTYPARAIKIIVGFAPGGG